LHLAGQTATGGKMELPGGFSVQRECGNLTFARPERKVCLDGRTVEPVELKVPGQTRFGGYLIEVGILDAGDPVENSKFEIPNLRFPASGGAERFDLEKVKLPLQIRSRLAGDRFIPLGLGKGKKLGKFLTAQHIPPDVRRRVLVVSDNEKIIWVWPIRISDHAKVTGGTRRILQLQIVEAATEAR
jgi:tRNA(Ile)-lysidine synthetase-like protein